MSPRNVILICGIALVVLGGVVALTNYMNKGKKEQMPELTPDKKFSPQQPVSFQHPDFDMHTDCRICHTGYTLKDTVKIPHP